jgi:predicted AlkP superfamily phosphohydrolase/phosphomutase
MADSTSLESDGAKGNMELPPEPVPADRVLLLGIDGLSSAFVEAPLVSDSMPNLRDLLRQSCTGTLLSTTPPYTGPAWTTITTGVNPGRHGIFGFTDRAGHPVSDAKVAMPRIWDHVSEAGGRSIVINVPITFPPRSFEGLLVSGMPTPPGTSYTYPSELASKLAHFDYVIDVAVQEGTHEGTETLARLARMTEARGRAAAWLARREPWELFAIVFVLPDRLGHPWWKWLVPGHDMYESRAADRIRNRARVCLRVLDSAIGELLSMVPPRTAVVTCSDHGFGPLRADVFFDIALASEGFINAPVGHPIRRFTAKVGRSRIARVMPARVQDWGKDKLFRMTEMDSRLAWTAPSYESGVRLSGAAGRDVQDRVSSMLQNLRDPQGAPIVRAVRRRDEVYQGPLTDDAPDLLCEMWDETVGLHEGLHASHVWVSRERTAWGTHATEGVIGLQGASSSLHGNAADVTPTILTLLGLRASGLDGRPLVRGSANEKVITGMSHADTEHTHVYSADQEAAVLDHLRGLGYVD